MSVANAQMGLSRVSNAHADAALCILKRMLHLFVGGADLRLWNDNSYSVARGPPAFTLLLRDPMLLRSLMSTRGAVQGEASRTMSALLSPGNVWLPPILGSPTSRTRQCAPTVRTGADCAVLLHAAQCPPVVASAPS